MGLQPPDIPGYRHVPQNMQTQNLSFTWRRSLKSGRANIEMDDFSSSGEVGESQPTLMASAAHPSKAHHVYVLPGPDTCLENLFNVHTCIVFWLFFWFYQSNHAPTFFDIFFENCAYLGNQIPPTFPPEFSLYPAQ